MNNPRFSDYVTSGAFVMSLTRNQISGLSTVCASGEGWIPNAASLERKGLVELLPAPGKFEAERTEYRATRAGLLCAALIYEAGLSNGPPDPVAAEFDAMRAEMLACRQEAKEARLCARSSLARLGEAEAELKNALGEIARLKTGQHQKLQMHFRVRDPLPDVSDDVLRQMALEPTD